MTIAKYIDTHLSHSKTFKVPIVECDRGITLGMIDFWTFVIFFVVKFVIFGHFFRTTLNVQKRPIKVAIET